jgi:hypothetical protein
MTTKHLKNLCLITLSSLFLGGCNLSATLNKKPSGIDITTTPMSTVYLGDQQVGETPYKNDNIKAGEYVLKLVPVATSGATLATWETKLKLTPQTTTIIARAFAASDADVASSILELQPEKGSKAAHLSVISDPSTVNVTIDSQPHGFTPLSKLSLDPGNHTLVVSSPGYESQSLVVNLVAGYNLVANLKLASKSITFTTPSPSPSAEPLPSISPTPKPTLVASSSAATVTKPYVEIADTVDTQGLGGLNVRSSASSTSDILGIARIGEKLPYISTSAAGWHQVTFEGQAGWVSGKYSTVYK